LTINGFGTIIESYSVERVLMSYVVFKHNKEYGPRKGLEGPFHYLNGQVLYYDNKEGKYYDPTTDFYVPDEDVSQLQNMIFDALKK
jgi:hypothetical protein